MKLTTAILGLLLLCSCARGAMTEEEQASAYIERLESAEAVAAEDYSEMVSFYCTAMDRHFAALEPHARAYAAAPSDSAGAVLKSKVDSVAATQVVKLGSALAARTSAMPDSVASRFSTFLQFYINRLNRYQ